MSRRRRGVLGSGIGRVLHDDRGCEAPERRRRGLHVLRLDRLVALRPRHAQRLGGQRVDLAGHAARPRGDVAAGLPRELARPVAARRGDPMMDVAPDLRDRQRLEPRAHRDALTERDQRGVVEPGLEQRQADQQHLEGAAHLLRGIGQQTQLLEHLAGQGVGVVHDQHRDLPAARVLREHAFEAREQLRPARAVRRLGTEAADDRFEELGAGQRGVGEEGGPDARAPARERLVGERGLADAGIAGDEQERLPRSEPILQPAEHLRAAEGLEEDLA